METTTWQIVWKHDPLEPSSTHTRKTPSHGIILATYEDGLDVWSASVRVPDILPLCGCGWQEQTEGHTSFGPCTKSSKIVRKTWNNGQREVEDNTRNGFDMASRKMACQTHERQRGWSTMVSQILAGSSSSHVTTCTRCENGLYPLYRAIE